MADEQKSKRNEKDLPGKADFLHLAY